MKDNLIAFPARCGIREEAARWLARLDGGPLDTVDAGRLRDWLAADSRNRACLLELAATFDDTNVLAELAELFPLQTDKREKAVHRINKISIHPAITAACAVVAMMAVFYGVYRSFDGGVQTGDAVPVMETAYRTGIGEQRSYKLADGSTVLLNTDSWIEVDFTAMERGVRLLSGEVHFEVARDEDIPFVVYTRMGRIRVVGTAFNVRLSKDAVDVTVTQGEVELHRRPPVQPAVTELSVTEVKEDILTLRAGQRLRFDHTREILETVSPVEIEQTLSWQRGILIFEGETLTAAVREISRYTEKEIVIADENLGHIRVGGFFKSDDIDATLRTLEDNFNIRVTRLNPDRILLSSRE